MSWPGLAIVPATTPQDLCYDLDCGLVVYGINDVHLQIVDARASNYVQRSPIQPKKSLRVVEVAVADRPWASIPTAFQRHVLDQAERGPQLLRSNVSLYAIGRGED